MSKTINILGDTPKEQWLSATHIYEVCIISNLDNALSKLEEIEMNTDINISECRESIRIARRESLNFINDMRQVIQGALDHD